MLLLALQNQNSILFEVYYFTTLTPEHLVRNRTGKGSVTEEILAQSFENDQRISTAPMEIHAPLKEGMYGIFMTSNLLFSIFSIFIITYYYPFVLTLPLSWQISSRSFRSVNIWWFFFNSRICYLQKEMFFRKWRTKIKSNNLWTTYWWDCRKPWRGNAYITYGKK